MHLAKVIGPHNFVKSVIRTEEHIPDIEAISSHPLLLSLEDAPVEDFTRAFEGVDIVYFSAGAGGKGGAERTKKVDYEGAVKVFDAIEGVKGVKPRLVLVSAIDVRNPDGKVPEYYVSQRCRLRRCITLNSCRMMRTLQHPRPGGVASALI